MKSGWETTWDVIKAILMVVSCVFIIFFIVSLFTSHEVIDAGTKKQINNGSSRNGKNRFF